MTAPITDNIQRAEQLLQTAQTQALAGKLEDAENALDECIALQPDYVVALDLAGRVALAQNKLDKAETYARRAVHLKPHAQLLLPLAEIMQRKGVHAKAASYFERILPALPNDARVLSGLVESYNSLGQTTDAARCAEQLVRLDPRNWRTAWLYANLLPGDKLPEGLAALEAARPAADAPLEERLGYLSWVAPYKEWAMRVRHRLPAYHVNSIDELGFAFARQDMAELEAAADQLLARGWVTEPCLMIKAGCLVARKELGSAEKIFNALADQTSKTIYRNVAFADEFLECLPQIDGPRALDGLPEVRVVAPATFIDDHIIYLSCNAQYFFRFGRVLLQSIDDRAKKAQVQLHIMDGSAQDLREIDAYCRSLTKVTIGLTAEEAAHLFSKDGVSPNQYYHSIRFLRFYEHVKAHGKMSWMMDVDALMNRDPATLFEQADGFDTAFRARPGRLEPWNQLSACLFGVRATPAGLEFLGLTARFILEFYRRKQLGWGIDQLAMFSAYEYLRRHKRVPKTLLLGMVATDMTHSDEGYVWLTAGSEKFFQFDSARQNIELPESYQNIRYYNAFKNYLSQS